MAKLSIAALRIKDLHAETFIPSSHSDLACAVDAVCLRVPDDVATSRPPPLQANGIPLGIGSPRLKRTNCAVIALMPCAFKWREFAKQESSRVT